MEEIKSILPSVWSRCQGYVRGWRTNAKVVVIESDDWGSIRVSSRSAYDELVARGWAMERSCYSVDALETDEDLELLYSVLESVRDCRGRPACMTANMVTANPDFQRIREAEFKEYYYQPVESALASSSQRKGVAESWHEGMKKKVFLPQLHAREHVQWWEWLEALRNGSEEATTTFGLGMCGVPLAVSKESQSFYKPIYVRRDRLEAHGVDVESVVRESVELFERQFGFRSLSTIAPNVTWSENIERIWSSLGIKYLQGGFIQYLSMPNGTRRRSHFVGERNPHGCLYLVRNCNFEPSKRPKGNSWEKCLSEISLAFKFKKPAIVCSHRVNYIGAIDPDNRDRGLHQLKALLGAICSRWPDVYFLSSPELGYMVEQGFSRVEELEGKEDYIFPAVDIV